MKFLAKIWEGIKQLFSGLSGVLKTAIHTGVTITEKIKDFDTANPEYADILTAIIPGHYDNDVKNWLRSHIPDILVKLKLAEGCADLSDPNEITLCAIKTLQAMDGNIKSAFLHNLSVLIAQVASDGQLDWKDGVYLLQWYYEHKDDKDVAVEA